MKMLRSVLLIAFCVASLASAFPETKPAAAAPAAARIIAGSKIYISTMDGFETYLAAALGKKKVPLTIVGDKALADYVITGVSESQKAGWAKMVFLGSGQSHEEASVTVTSVKTGEVVFAYAVNKGNSVHGRQSTAEACAKHIKENIDGK